MKELFQPFWNFLDEHTCYAASTGKKNYLKRSNIMLRAEKWQAEGVCSCNDLSLLILALFISQQ